MQKSYFLLELVVIINKSSPNQARLSVYIFDQARLSVYIFDFRTLVADFDLFWRIKLKK